MTIPPGGAPPLENPLFKEILAAVPPFTRTLNADELQAAEWRLDRGMPGIVRREAGRSSGGDPLHVLTAGNGSRQAVVLALLRADEPAGAMSLLSLAQFLAADDRLNAALDFTFHIVAVSDPDGAQLNQARTGTADTLLNRSHRFFRRAADEEVARTFPIRHRGWNFDQPPPETRALMTLIKETKPELICTVHADVLTGVRFHLSEHAVGLAPILQQTARAQGLPLHPGDRLSPWGYGGDGGTEVPEAGSGVYNLLSGPSLYDRLAADAGTGGAAGSGLGADPATGLEDFFGHGGSVFDFARSIDPGVMAVTITAPLFLAAEMRDDSPSQRSWGSLVRDRVEMAETFYDLAGQATADTMSEPSPANPFARALLYFIEAGRRDTALRRRTAKVHPAAGEYATKAQTVSQLYTPQAEQLAVLGLLRRCLLWERELAEPVSPEAQAIDQGLEGIEKEMKRWGRELQADVRCRPAAVQNIVRVHLGGILYAAAFCATR
ncbi:MAG: M14 family zinc carboxypeptidase [Thermaerobacterales bacterium]